MVWTLRLGVSAVKKEIRKINRRGAEMGGWESLRIFSLLLPRGSTQSLATHPLPTRNFKVCDRMNRIYWVRSFGQRSGALSASCPSC
jgi:hypothetical protein